MEPGAPSFGRAIGAFDGRVHFPDEAGYEQARVGRVFNARVPDRFPTVIVEAECEADVISAVRLARERGWRISVRSGGHSYPTWSLREEALLLDLGGMDRIRLEPASGSVIAQPAATGAKLLTALAAHGLMFQTGHAPDVGLGGFLLQGGAGWNTRGWGWACERIEALRVVTADGLLVDADPSRNEDLYWAARGAGHGFPGVVVDFRLATRPLPEVLLESSYVCDADAIEATLAWALETQEAISPAVEFGIVGAHDPDSGRPIIVLWALVFGESDNHARADLAPFESSPAAERAIFKLEATPTTLAEQFEKIARQNPKGLRYAVDSAWLDATPEETAKTLRRAFAELPTRQSDILWMSMGAHPPAGEDMAFSLSTDSYFAAFAKWESESDDAVCEQWLGECMSELDPISRGVFLGDCDLARREAPFLSPGHRERLEQIRRRRDADGLFCSYMTATEIGR